MLADLIFFLWIFKNFTKILNFGGKFYSERVASKMLKLIGSAVFTFIEYKKRLTNRIAK